MMPSGRGAAHVGECRPRGCQVYLPTLSRSFTELLAAHGCTYVYTGLESSSEALRTAVGKRGLGASLASERLRWISGAGMGLGLSLMFGVIDPAGELLETEQTVGETVQFVEGLLRGGLDVAGIYPNVLTVLSGTRLARAIELGGAALDFYRVPRTAEFEDMEDGAVGHNFVTLGLDAERRLRTRVVEASKHLSTLGGRRTAEEVPSSIGGVICLGGAEGITGAVEPTQTGLKISGGIALATK